MRPLLALTLCFCVSACDEGTNSANEADPAKTEDADKKSDDGDADKKPKSDDADATSKTPDTKPDTTVAEPTPDDPEAPADDAAKPEITPPGGEPNECEKKCLDSRRAEAVAWEEIERGCKMQCAAKDDEG